MLATESVGSALAADSALAQRITEQLGASFTCDQLEGGQSNTSYRLHGRAQSLVLRINRTGLPGTDRAREQQVLARVSSCAFAPETLYCSNDYWLYRFVIGPVLSSEDFGSTTTVRQAVTALTMVHQTDCGGVIASLDMPAYLQALEAAGSPTTDGLRALRDPARRAAEQEYRPGIALCHGDPLHSNMVRRPGGLLLLDWEYACAGDPLFDLAALGHYQHLNDRLLLSLYPGIDASEFPRLVALRGLFAYICGLWQQITQINHRKSAPKV